MVWRMTCRAESRTILLYLHLPVAAHPWPCTLDVTALANAGEEQLQNLDSKGMEPARGCV